MRSLLSGLQKVGFWSMALLVDEFGDDKTTRWGPVVAAGPTGSERCQCYTQPSSQVATHSGTARQRRYGTYFNGRTCQGSRPKGQQVCTWLGEKEKRLTGQLMMPLLHQYQNLLGQLPVELIQVAGRD